MELRCQKINYPAALPRSRSVDAASASSYPVVSAKTCMAVMLPPTRFDTLGNVTEATVLAEFTGTSAANTYMVIGCELPPVELR
jgi:hypothetical protein